MFSSTRKAEKVLKVRNSQLTLDCSEQTWSFYGARLTIPKLEKLLSSLVWAVKGGVSSTDKQVVSQFTHNNCSVVYYETTPLLSGC